MAVRLEFCPLEAVDELMAFVRNHWNAAHVLGNSRAMMDWQHRDEANARYNFLIARDESDGRIVGMLGFIPSSRYDPALADDRETIWLVMWKVVAGYSAGLGLMLLRDLPRRLNPCWIGTAGLNAATCGIYAALGYRTGSLERYFRFAPGLTAPKLAVIPPGGGARPAPSTGGSLTRSNPDAVLAFDGNGTHTPAKTGRQFVTRYSDHPVYDYALWHARTGTAEAIIATRVCTHAGAAALRIVDLLGDPAAIAGCGQAFDDLLLSHDAEYLDWFTAAGGEHAIAAGLRLLDPAGPLVLPGYFEPFERSNVEIRWSLKGPEGELAIGKGDCDQDRPSFWTDAAN